MEEINITNDEVISSVFLKSRHLARVSGKETLFYGTDHQGTTVLVTDNNGQMVWTAESSPFGDTVMLGDVIREDLKLKYTGKDLDEDTGLYYFNARWYDAGTGRFISEDPARDGSNWHVYVSNNPLKYVDPTGLIKLFLTAEAEIAAPFGLDGGASLVIDTKNIAGDKSDIYVTKGTTAGGSLGVAFGAGFALREVDGKSASADFNLGSFSVTLSLDDKGFNGLAITGGPGAGFAVSDTETKNTGVLNKFANWLTDKIMSAEIGNPTRMNPEILEKNLNDILDGKKDPNQIQEGYQNPITGSHGNISDDPLDEIRREKKEREKREKDKRTGETSSNNEPESTEEDDEEDSDPVGE